MNSRAAEYWASGAGLAHITPPTSPNPEGPEFGQRLALIIGLESRVLDYGCGVGRLARLFSPDLYRGVDISPRALAIARERWPAYRFGDVNEAFDGDADVTLFHTVLLHVPDNEAPDLIVGISTKRVVVSEIMGRRWRRAGDPPVFNRDAKDYVRLFEAAGFERQAAYSLPYPHYPSEHLTVLDFAKPAAR